MKLVAAAIVLLLAGGSAAEAWPWSSKKPKLPKPIDSPVVRPKVREDHKAGKRTGQHSKRLEDPTHGNEWGKLFNLKNRHGLPHNLDLER